MKIGKTPKYNLISVGSYGSVLALKACSVSVAVSGVFVYARSSVYLFKEVEAKVHVQFVVCDVLVVI